MFDLLIFTQYPKTYGPKRFKEEAEKIGLNCKIKSYKYSDLNNLPEAKFIILREPKISIKYYALRDMVLRHYVKTKSKILNSKSYLHWSVLDKITQHQEFAKAGIPHVKTLKIKDPRNPNIEYPFIAKNKLGSHGDSVYKIENNNDLNKVLEKHKIEDLLFQEFQIAGFDLRVIVINFKVVGIMKRTPRKGEFLSNYSQGGEVTKLNINNEKEKIIKLIAIRTAKHFKLDYVGVDIMLGNDNKWKVLEVNRACQFQGFEKATGINIAQEIIKYLII